jgi:hypothetical protein
MTTTQISRRRVLKATSAVACAVAIPSLISTGALACSSTAHRARKNIDELTQSELATYEHAVRLMRERATSAAGQSFSHPALRQSSTLDSRLAGTPWDRRHLALVEAQLRATDPARTAEIAVPYWNFTRPASGIAYPLAFERVGSPLFAGHRDNPGQLDAVFWSYHAYVETARDAWEREHAPLGPGVAAHVWIGSNTVEIRTVRVRAA